MAWTYVITKDLTKGFFSLSTKSGKEVQRIHGAHLKQYVTPPNSLENVPVSIDDQESSSESPNLSIDSPPLLPLPSDVDQSEDDEFDTSIDSIPPLPHQLLIKSVTTLHYLMPNPLSAIILTLLNELLAAPSYLFYYNHPNNAT